MNDRSGHQDPSGPIAAMGSVRQRDCRGCRRQARGGELVHLRRARRRREHGRRSPPPARARTVRRHGSASMQPGTSRESQGRSATTSDGGARGVHLATHRAAPRPCAAHAGAPVHRPQPGAGRARPPAPRRSGPRLQRRRCSRPTVRDAPRRRAHPRHRETGVARRVEHRHPPISAPSSPVRSAN